MYKFVSYLGTLLFVLFLGLNTSRTHATETTGYDLKRNRNIFMNADADPTARLLAFTELETIIDHDWSQGVHLLKSAKISDSNIDILLKAYDSIAQSEKLKFSQKIEVHSNIVQTILNDSQSPAVRLECLRRLRIHLFPEEGGGIYSNEEDKREFGTQLAETFYKLWFSQATSFALKLKALRCYLNYKSGFSEPFLEQTKDFGATIFENLCGISDIDIIRDSDYCLGLFAFGVQESSEWICQNIILKSKVPLEIRYPIFVDFLSNNDQSNDKYFFKKFYINQDYHLLFRSLAYFQALQQSTAQENMHIKWGLSLIQSLSQFDEPTLNLSGWMADYLAELLEAAREILLNFGDTKQNLLVIPLAWKVVNMPAALSLKEDAYNYLLQNENSGNKKLLLEKILVPPLFTITQKEATLSLTASGGLEDQIAGLGLVVRYHSNIQIVNICQDCLLQTANNKDVEKRMQIKAWTHLARTQFQEIKEQSFEALMAFVCSQSKDYPEYEEFVAIRRQAADAITELLPQKDIRVQKAIQLMIDSEDLSDKTSPYYIYKQLLEKRKQQVKHQPQKQECTVRIPDVADIDKSKDEVQILTLNLAKFAKPRARIDIPKVTRKDFQALTSSLGLEFNFLKGEKGTELKTLMVDMAPSQLIGDWDEQAKQYKGGIKDDPFFINMFYIIDQGNEGAFDTTIFHLSHIILHLQKLSCSAEKDMLLSPQGNGTLQVLLNVLTCPTGKAKGLRHTYNLFMDNTHDLDEKKLEQSGDVEFIKMHIDQILHKYRENLLFVYGPFMAEVTKYIDVKEVDIPHNTQYLNSLIGDCIGLQYEGEMIPFDENARGTNAHLRDLSKQEVLDIYYKHDTPIAEREEVRKGISQQLRQTTEKDNWKFYNKLARLFTNSRLCVNFDDAYVPSLMPEGAISLLLKNGDLIPVSK